MLEWQFQIYRNYICIRCFYDVLKPKYGSKIKLAYTDTDSFRIHTEAEDIYKDFKEIGEHMDFCDYPKDHPNHNVENKKALGKFKDELNGEIMTEFIGLKPKMYAFKVEGETAKEAQDHRKAKGVPKSIVKKHIMFEDFKKTHEDLESKKKYVNFNCIRSKNHQIYSLNINKCSLSNFENKRYYISNNHSLPYGHYSLINN